jgi:hypothetical protein
MASLNEIAEILAEREGRQYDTVFTEEMKPLVHIWRSRLVRDSLERNRADRVFFRQYFEIPMIAVNSSDLPGFPDIPIMRSECQLPNPLRANGLILDYIGSVDKLTTFQLFTEQHEILPALKARYTGHLPKALWLNNYIYAFNTLTLPYVGGAAIFDDVRALDNIGCTCNGATCYDDDLEYPAPRDIQQRIIQSILSVELRQPVKVQPNQVPVDAPEKA